MKKDYVSSLKAKFRIKEAIIEDIRELILTGKLAPDDVIHESELTNRFGKSRSPVREAKNLFTKETPPSINQLKPQKIRMQNENH
jgi:DNA-binding GntR family transcriptional regulator